MWGFAALFASRPDVAALLLAFAFGVAGTRAGMAQRAAFAEQFEAQRAGNRCGFQQAHLDAIAEPVRFAGAAADHRMIGFIEAEIFLTERRDRNKAVRASVNEPHKQT